MSNFFQKIHITDNLYDAVSEEHLRHIAKVAAQFERVLWVGSAGLAEQLPIILQWGKEQEKKRLLTAIMIRNT